MKKLITIVIIGICIWLAYQYPHAMLNPGELLQAHQKLNNKCTDCHQPFWGIDSKKCISCHQLSEIGRDTITGMMNNKMAFHQDLGNVECTTCHTDHKGITPGKNLTNFTHEILTQDQLKTCSRCHSKPADNLHNALSADCGSCHQTGGWKQSVTFDHEMISMDKTNCLSCHKLPPDDFHSPGMTACLSCHTTSQWKPSTFNHDKYFIFDSHHPSTCNNCHTTKDYKSFTCYNCHEHSESKIADEHYEHGITNFTNCAKCHRSGNKHDINESSEGNYKNKRSNEREGKRHPEKGDKHHDD